MSGPGVGRVMCAAFSIGLLAGCGPRTESSDSAAAPEVAVRARALETRVFQDQVSAPGQWRSSGEVVIVAPTTAIVESLDARVGDRVPAGRTVAWLVTRESQAALTGAQTLAQQAHDEASRAEAAHAIELARRDVIRIAVKAPRAGVVVRRGVEAGSLVSESAEILALVPAGSIVFEAHVAAADAARMHPGQQASIREEGGSPTAATVLRVLPVASSSDQATLVWLRPVSGATPALERYGTATIVVGSPHRALAVPDSALVEDDLTGESRVAVIEPGDRAVWTRVSLGAAADGWHELERSPLAAGQRVVVEGQRGLPDSAQVKPAP